MKKTILILAAVSALSATSVMAQTASSPYVNFGLSQRHTDNSDTLSLNGRVGTYLNDNFSVEAEGGFGINEDTVSGVKLKERGNLGAFAVGHLPVNEEFSLLGRMGYQHTWAEAKLGNITTKDDDGSFAIGAGAQYMFDGNNGIRGDYTRLTKNDGVDNFAISYVHKF